MDSFWDLLGIIYRFFLALIRDVRGILLLKKVKTAVTELMIENSTVYNEFEKIAKRQPQKACIIFNDKIWTFKDMFDYTNHIAGLFMKKFNLKKGDCVALFMENKPEYAGIWLGLSKLGVITALINTNLKNESLLHCINISNACIVIFDSTLEPSIDDIRDRLSDEIELIVQGEEAKSTNAVNLENLLNDHPLEIVQSPHVATSEDAILYIYTSGTTGLPKPALIKQSRMFSIPYLFFKMANLTQNDIVYVTLPIYHGNGGVIGVGSALMQGATVVLRRKFSASNFWKDCIKYNCTAFVYVGEVCRFLVYQPPSPLDRQHKIRIAIGNGMRANIWQEFNRRFGVQCCEFYASSEGNCSIVNLDHKIGACGFIPLINRVYPLMPIFIIKIDQDMKPIRDVNGYCIKCKSGEKGLIIGIIEETPLRAFNGYVNNLEESKKKIINDVFAKGQKAYNSGDLMVMDEYGYVYFCDRLGDTYRWKGENVSTIEVENIISKRIDFKEVVVFGVVIPGHEGRAGMAVIDADLQSIDLKKLASQIDTDLPSYARPLFLRFTNDIDHTGTFKTSKLRLVDESYNVKKIKRDKVLYFNPIEKAYKDLDQNVYELIQSGQMKI